MVTETSTNRLPATVSLGLKIAVKLGAEVAGRLCQLIFVLLAARGLGAEGFGLYSLALFYGFLAGQLADGGLHLLVNRGEVRAEQNIGAEALAAKLGVAVVMAPLLAIVALLYSPNPAIAVSFWLISYSFVIYSFTEFSFSLIRAHGQLYREAQIVLFYRVFLLAMGFALLQWGIGGLALAHVGCTGLITLWSLRIASRYLSRQKPNFRAGLLIWKRALPIGMGLILSMLAFRVDIPLLAAFRDRAEVGIYGAAYRLFEPSLMVPAAILAGYFPVLVRAAGTPTLFFKGSIKLLLLLGIGGVVAALGLAALSGWLTPSLYGSDYAAAGELLAILAIAVPVMYLNYGLTHMLIALNEEKANTLFFGAALLVNVGANLCLIPIWGGTGAALATGFTELTLCLLCGARLYKKYTSS